MYDFYDLKPRHEPTPNLPTDAINYNGHWLDKEIEGFRTLTVSGRESLSRQINAPNKVGDGAIYLNSRLESRNIEVEFELKTNNITEFNTKIAKLNQILYVPNVPIYFNDDKLFRYTGSVVSIGLDKPLLTTKGKIEINCPDPFKYSTELNITGTNSVVKIMDSNLVYAQAPKRIDFIPITNISGLIISCMGKRIVFNEAISANARMVIDFKNLQIKVNGINRLMALDLSSNFSDFTIINGGIITFSVQGKYVIYYEVKRL